MDEPTASLDRNEVKRFFEAIRGLKAGGLAFLFITHFLDQVFAISYRMAILRNGKLVKLQPLGALTRTEIARLMFEDDVPDEGSVTVGNWVLTLRKLAQAIAAGFGFCP